MGNMCVCIYIYIIYCVCVPVCKSPICQNVVFNTHTPPLNGIQQTLTSFTPPSCTLKIMIMCTFIKLHAYL